MRRLNKEGEISELDLELEPAHLHLADEFGITPAKADEIYKRSIDLYREAGEGGADEVSKFWKFILIEISEDRNPALAAICFRMAFDFRISNHESMRRHALDFGLTPAAISKRVKAIQSRHNIPIGTFNKSAQAVATYKQFNGNAKDRIASRPKIKKKGKITPVELVVKKYPERFEKFRHYLVRMSINQNTDDIIDSICADKNWSQNLATLFQASKLESVNEFVDQVLEFAASRDRLGDGKAAR